MYDKKIHVNLILSHTTIGNEHPGFIWISIVSSPSAEVLESIGFVEMTDQRQHFHKDVAEAVECNRKSVQSYWWMLVFSPQNGASVPCNTCMFWHTLVSLKVPLKMAAVWVFGQWMPIFDDQSTCDMRWLMKGNQVCVIECSFLQDSGQPIYHLTTNVIWLHIPMKWMKEILKVPCSFNTKASLCFV